MQMLITTSLSTQHLQQIRQVRMLTHTHGLCILMLCIILCYDHDIMSSLCSGPRSSERRLHGAVVLCLGLLSVVLLVGLISLGVSYWDLAAEHSTVKANLTERLQASNDKLSSVSEERDLLNANLTSVSKELDRLQSLSKQMDVWLWLAVMLLFNHTSLTQNWTQKERLLRKYRPCGCSRMFQNERTCPAGWQMFSITCYLFSTKTDSWENGRQDCRDRGAELVTIDTDEEQEFISKIIKEDTWIGLNDRDKEGTWRWIDGTPPTVVYWFETQPDNGGGNPKWGEEDCIHLIFAAGPERVADRSLWWRSPSLPFSAACNVV
ncbi:C-type lectin domain family 4 member A-like isoform X4 [Acanthopagrus latus]|uniref:C-type lectin domain family 4 member A-like isoform X4 n=1 Tax=Acanthopagrus latus TaxID=8177 RepID=UPI00187C9FC5|nr:C-type lectin domain family 4 member A-like isoform X4 [Acanthopagrus latus]